MGSSLINPDFFELKQCISTELFFSATHPRVPGHQRRLPPAISDSAVVAEDKVFPISKPPTADKFKDFLTALLFRARSDVIVDGEIDGLIY